MELPDYDTRKIQQKKTGQKVQEPFEIEKTDICSLCNQKVDIQQSYDLDATSCCKKFMCKTCVDAKETEFMLLKESILKSASKKKSIRVNLHKLSLPCQVCNQPFEVVKAIFKFENIFEAIRTGNEEIVQRFLAKESIDLEDEDGNNNTPLILATKLGYLGIVKALLKAGALPNHMVKNKEVSLMYACQKPDILIIKELLDFKADLGIKNNNNEDCFAIIKKHDEETEKKIRNLFSIAEFRLNKEKDVGDTVLHLAVLSGDNSILRSILENGAPIGPFVTEVTPLADAFRKGDMKAVRALLADPINRKKIPVNSENSRGETPLMDASLIGDRQMIKTLLKFKADPRKTNHQGRDAQEILTTCYDSNKETTKKILRDLERATFRLNIKEADINDTPLHYAALYKGKKNLTTIKYFAQTRNPPIPINCQNAVGNTPLHYACRIGSFHVIEELLYRKANPDLKNDKRENAFKIIKKYHDRNKKTQKIMELLSDARERLSIIKNKSGISELHWVALYENAWVDLYQDTTKASKNYKTSIIESLVDKGVPVDSKNDAGETPLMLACIRGYFEVVKKLLEFGANPHELNNAGENAFTITEKYAHRNKDSEKIMNLITMAGRRSKIIENNTYIKNSPLHLAALDGRITDIKLLVKKGCPVNCRNAAKETALFYASLMHNLSAVELLLKLGADPTLESYEGETAFTAIGLYQDELTNKIRDLLSRAEYWWSLKNKLKNTELHLAALNGDASQIKSLIEKGIFVDSKNDAGDTPLTYGSERGYIDVVKLLLAGGADPRVTNNKGLNALAMVNPYHEKNKEISRLLLIAKDKLNIKENKYQQASGLHRAVVLGDLEHVKFLISSGSSVNCKDIFAETPLIYACKLAKPEMIKLLLEKNADPHLKNYIDKDAFEIAKEYREGDQEIMNLLTNIPGEIVAKKM